MIDGYEVKRLSVDNRCLHNILFVNILEQMYQEWDRIDKPTEFVSLPEGTTYPVVGKIIMAVVPKKWPESTSKRILFSIVEATSIYNGILGVSQATSICS